MCGVAHRLEAEARAGVVDMHVGHDRKPRRAHTRPAPIVNTISGGITARIALGADSGLFLISVCDRSAIRFASANLMDHDPVPVMDLET
jgi:hypothetical protein